MPAPRPTVARRFAAVLVLGGLVPMANAVAPAAASPPSRGDDPVADARRDVERTRAEATAAAASYQAALAEQARLTDEIARLERDIPELRAEADEVRAKVRERAAELYKGFDPTAGVEQAAESGDEIDMARHAHLTEAVTDYDIDLSERLRELADRLQVAEEELKGKKAEQERVIAVLDEHRRRLDFELGAAQLAAARLEALAFAGATAGAAGGLVRSGAAVCPVRGVAVFTNDWGQPRSGGRTHEGTDVFAPYGTPLVAVIGGTVADTSGGLGGTAVDLVGDDGVRYYYAHLSRIERSSGRVETGDVVGYLGDSGNAAGGAPHLHFEMHPGGGPPVNPYPTLKVLCG